MSKQELIILGVDPGTQITGYGVIKVSGTLCTPIDFGCIRPPKKMSLEKRYLAIFNGIDELITRHKPDAVSVETQFVKENIASAMKLGMARAAVLIAAARRDVAIFEYAPRKAKLAVVGNGSASKHQVQQMMMHLLKLDRIPEPEDAADGLALALCHAFNREKLELLRNL